ncbi:MAG: hypothetical protein WAM81_02580, partial [Acidimicrobiia bacterium]
MEVPYVYGSGDSFVTHGNGALPARVGAAASADPPAEDGRDGFAAIVPGASRGEVVELKPAEI